MSKAIAIGMQDFEKIQKDGCFYIDKTNFIKEWWEKRDDATLIIRNFIKALLQDDLDAMNEYMNDVAE